MFTVLILDDQLMGRMVLEELLNSHYDEINIFQAESAKDALKILEKDIVHLVLSDIEMPEINGFEFVAMLRKETRTMHTPVMFISSHSPHEYEEELKGLKGFDFIEKPVDPKYFLPKVDNFNSLYAMIEYQSSIFSNRVIYSETNLSGNITMVSNAFVKISGYSREELLGQPHNLVRDPEMSSDIFKEIWELLENDQSWSGVISNLKKDAKETYILKATIYPRFIGDKKVGYASIRQDITLEEKSKARFKAILNAQDSIVVITDGKKLLQVNDILFKLYGFKDIKDFLSQYNCVCDLYVEKDEPHLMKMMGDQTWLEYIKDRPKEIHEAYMQDIDGNEHIYQVNHRGYLDDGNDIVILDDITELKRTTQMVLKQSKFAVMGEMIGMIAHQWRQPLTALNALMSKLNLKKRVGQLDDQTWKDSLVKHSELTKYMTDTITDFKNFLKEDREVFTTKVSEIAEKPHRFVEELLLKQNVEFIINYEDDSLKEKTVNISSSKLDQVFMNLYKNTLDEFIDQDKQDGKIMVSCKQVDKKLVYEVCDNAGGIPEDIINKIFDPYFSTKADNGTGIGLYMTKLIVENHVSGTIDVKNSDNGACFTVTIPIQENLASTASIQG